MRSSSEIYSTINVNLISPQVIAQGSPKKKSLSKDEGKLYEVCSYD